MKDRNDAHTIDGFADLELPPPAAPKAKPGPKPRNGEAMTGAERAKAFRDRKRAEREAERARFAEANPSSQVIDLSCDLQAALRARDR